MIFDKKDSCCEQKQKIVVSAENGNKHVLYNISQCDVYQFHIDGGINKSSKGKRCDFLVEAQSEEIHNAYVIELKGSDLPTAIEQILQTIKDYKGRLAGCKILPRIIIHKARTHDVGGNELRKLKTKYPGTVMRTIKYEEKV